MQASALAVCTAAAVLAAAQASADDVPDSHPESMSYERVITLARERAPELQLVRARIEEARGRLQGASALLAENPSIDAGAGARLGARGVSPDLSAALTQRLELGGKRGARLDVANAELEVAELESKDVERRAVREAATAFWQAIHARARGALAGAAVEDATTVLRAVEKRAEAGDVAALDVNVARAARARAEAERRSAVAEERRSDGELRAALGLEPGVALALEGSLHLDPPPPGATALAGVDHRPDLAAIQAAVAIAEAEHRAGEAAGWPDIALGAAYAYDDGDHIVGASVDVPIPLFQNGQGERAESRARAEGLKRAFLAQRAASLARVAAALESLDERAAAVTGLEHDALPAADENVRLARRAYAAGELPLAELIVIEREAAAVHREHLDALLAAVLSRIDVESETGALP